VVFDRLHTGLVVAVLAPEGVLEFGLGGGAVADLLGGGPEQRPQRYAVTDPARMDSARSFGTNCRTLRLTGGQGR